MSIMSCESQIVKFSLERNLPPLTLSVNSKTDSVFLLYYNENTPISFLISFSFIEIFTVSIIAHAANNDGLY